VAFIDDADRKEEVAATAAEAASLEARELATAKVAVTRALARHLGAVEAVGAGAGAVGEADVATQLLALV
jgi:hypothetical protein